jgi:NAD(P)-dependent dehydrogenase (short-subunit alcohol dehydrogenase family)
LLGTVHTCRAAIPGFKARGYGKIINISGGGATSPIPNISAYAASKAALVRLTETLAGELEKWRIDVNAVSPGLMVTRMQQRLLDADPGKVGSDYHARMRKEVESGGVPLSKPAGLCAYLASADSDGLTGRLLSAVWDQWPFSPEAREDLASDPEMYTLRRIVPEHRGRKRLGS